MKRRAFFKIIAAGLVASYAPIDWCIGLLRQEVILIDWVKINWLKDEDGPVYFDVRWKVDGSSDWTRTEEEVQLNPLGATSLSLTKTHAISIDTHDSCFIRGVTV